jgi:exopolysaccharide biosynthesis predicted pyruvyltransferase EpsI
MSGSLLNLFNQYKSKSFIFVQPGGNWGDHLIYFGAEHLAGEVGLNFVSKTKAEFLNLGEITDSVIYIHGGGAFNSWCSDSGFQLLAAALQKKDNVVIYGPASCGDNSDFLNEKLSECFSTNNSAVCYMFAREQKTYKMFGAISIIKENTTLLQDVDTAFHLTKEAIIQRVGEERFDYDFYAFRDDNEACSLGHDFSFNEVVFDPAIWCTSFDHWLKVHLYAKKIITNRTHSSVIGSILEKPTYLFSGSYHKNRSIWLETLKNKNVEWLEPSEAIGMVQKIWLDKVLPIFIKNSWKIRKAFLSLQKVPQK